MKPLSADGSVGSPHVRVGHRQAFNTQAPDSKSSGVFLCTEYPDWPGENEKMLKKKPARPGLVRARDRLLSESCKRGIRDYDFYAAILLPAGSGFIVGDR